MTSRVTSVPCPSTAGRLGPGNALVRGGLVRVANAAAACVVAVALGSCGTRPQPNVVLVVVDTLRADHTTPFRYRRDTTPHLARLAERGTTFERAWAQAPWTLPSMTSMMTGRYVLANYASIPPGERTLAERMRDAGYSTAAVVANPLLFEGTGFERGFDAYQVAEMQRGRKTMRSGDVTRLLRERIDVSGRPFFWWIQLYDPHAPYQPPQRLRFEVGEVTAERAAELAERQPANAPERIDLEGARNIEDVIAWYDGEIRFADEAISALVQLLDERGLADETLVIVTSDHGEGMYDHAEEKEGEDRTRYGLTIAHGDHVFEEAVHVPLIVAGPGFDAGARRRDLAGNVDLLPTVLAAAGIEPDRGAHGRDLANPAAAPAAMFTFGTRHHAVRTDDDRKLIHEVRPAGGAEERTARLHLLDRSVDGEVMLFDLGSDPDERRDLSTARPDDVRFLTDLLERWQEAHRDALGDASAVPNDMTRRLRELGYTK